MLSDANQERDIILINRAIDRALYYELSDCVQAGKNMIGVLFFLLRSAAIPTLRFGWGAVFGIAILTM